MRALPEHSHPYVHGKLRRAAFPLLLLACGALPTELELPDGGMLTEPPDSGTTLHGDFCAPCRSSADCAEPGSICVGQPGHCGRDCSQGQACPTGTTCRPLAAGKMPLGAQCMPAAPACDVSTTLTLTCDVGWSNWTDAYLGAQCRSCHRHPMSFLSAADVRVQAETIRILVDKNVMPPGGATAADREKLFTFLACGTAAPPSGR